MKIAIIGAGNVGSTLGSRWSKLGHDITYAVRDVNSEKAINALAKTPDAKATGIKEAAKSNDILVLTTPWQAAEQVIEKFGDISGKILIDCTNPLMGLRITLSDTSAGEEINAMAFGAHVVKAFNSIGFNIMQNPVFNDEKSVHFICGNYENANQIVKKLSDDLGFDTVIMGPIENARLLEHFALLWINLAHAQGFGREIAFKFIRK